MRSVSFLAVLALPLTAVAAAPAPQPEAPPLASATPLAIPSPARCAPPRVTYAGPGQAATRVQKLGEQPPANQYLAVSRQVGGCPEPAIVRTGISG